MTSVENTYKATLDHLPRKAAEKITQALSANDIASLKQVSKKLKKKLYLPALFDKISKLTPTEIGKFLSDRKRDRCHGTVLYKLQENKNVTPIDYALFALTTPDVAELDTEKLAEAIAYIKKNVIRSENILASLQVIYAYKSGDIDTLSTLLQRGNIYLNLSGFDFSKIKQPLKIISCDHAYLSSTNFEGCDLQNSQLRFATINNCRFHNANLDHANLDGSQILFNHFNHASMKLASIKDSKIYRTKFAGANLEMADFTKSELEDCGFAAANLKNCHLDDASIHSVHLECANIDEALGVPKFSGNDDYAYFFSQDTLHDNAKFQKQLERLLRAEISSYRITSYIDLMFYHNIQRNHAELVKYFTDLCALGLAFLDGGKALGQHYGRYNVTFGISELNRFMNDIRNDFKILSMDTVAQMVLAEMDNALDYNQYSTEFAVGFRYFPESTSEQRFLARVNAFDTLAALLQREDVIRECSYAVKKKMADRLNWMRSQLNQIVNDNHHWKDGNSHLIKAMDRVNKIHVSINKTATDDVRKIKIDLLPPDQRAYMNTLISAFFTGRKINEVFIDRFIKRCLGVNFEKKLIVSTIIRQIKQNTDYSDDEKHRLLTHLIKHKVATDHENLLPKIANTIGSLFGVRVIKTARELKVEARLAKLAH